MTENLILGLACAIIVWLVYCQSRLGKQVATLESTLRQIRVAGSTEFEESISQIIDELKTAADAACDEVSQKIEALKETQTESLSSPSGLSDVTPLLGKSLPLGLIVQLADDGLSTIDIARKAAVGIAEVDLALRFRRRRAPALRFKPVGQIDQRPHKEVVAA